LNHPSRTTFLLLSKAILMFKNWKENEKERRESKKFTGKKTATTIEGNAFGMPIFQARLYLIWKTLKVAQNNYSFSNFKSYEKKI